MLTAIIVENILLLNIKQMPFSKLDDKAVLD